MSKASENYTNRYNALMKKLIILLLLSISIHQMGLTQNLKSDTLSIIFNQKGCFAWQYQNLSVLKNDSSSTLYFNSSFNENLVDSVINFDQDTNFIKLPINSDKMQELLDFRNNVLSIKKDTLIDVPLTTYIIIQNRKKVIIKTNSLEPKFFSLLKSITDLF